LKNILMLLLLLLASTARGQETYDSLKVVNPGSFSDAQDNEYLTSLINHCSTSAITLFALPTYVTNAMAGCVTVPSAATVTQGNGVAGYAEAAGDGVRGVGVFGMARTTASGGRVWGGNFAASDQRAFPAPVALYGAELDVNVHNQGSVPVGELITGRWTKQPQFGIALDIAPPLDCCHWPMGLRFETGATSTVSAEGAALWFQPVAAAANEPSQGIFFLSNAPDSGQVGSAMNLLPNGNLSVTFPGSPTGALAVQLTRLTPLLFSALPPCDSELEGTQASVKDSGTKEWGATIEPGGTNHVLAYCDGTSWTVSAR
jgi:hypothetical protein